MPAQMRLPSTSTQKTWLSGRPLAVVKFSQRKRGMSCATRRPGEARDEQSNAIATRFVLS